MTTPLDYYDIVWRMVAAVLCGGVIGLERDLRRMPTGFRTMAIVSLGACVAALAGERTGDAAAFSRIAQGVVTGIGFLGAGVILQRGDKIRHVKGLTTAAAIWLTAAIGLMCGLGELQLAVAASALAIAVLVLDFVGSRLFQKPDQPRDPPEEDTFTSRDGD
ncbi:MgtC/SapB family protein [Hyphomicrobium sp. MC1]|uniref:MgtC/SapB family protein n=1 Tax=Hyphomicrobium sp. (strain MC1) TaxID=717785 RepID=UPI000213E47C|nr:MgtC/SapB family protein [Hyphomicrobium sp. MC1]CCB67121.1 MgtC/SapB transporter [Hyphomicrobium sp. MC1]